MKKATKKSKSVNQTSVPETTAPVVPLPDEVTIPVVLPEEVGTVEVLPSGASTTSKVEELVAGILSDADSGMEDASIDTEALVIGRPSRAIAFRAHPTLHHDVKLFALKTGVGKEYFLVTKSMEGKLDNIDRYTIFYCVHIDGSRFLWPVSATSSDGYSRSARMIAIAATKVWVRLVSDRSKGTYIKREFPGVSDVPMWGPDKTFMELLVEGFGEERIISSTDHYIWKEMWMQK